MDMRIIGHAKGAPLAPVPPSQVSAADVHNEQTAKLIERLDRGRSRLTHDASPQSSPSKPGRRHTRSPLRATATPHESPVKLIQPREDACALGDAGGGLDEARPGSGGSSPRLSRRNLFQAGAMTLLGCSCSVCGPRPAQAGAWGYGTMQTVQEVDGPSVWGGMCHTGTQQSPVDIRLQEKVGRTATPTPNEGRITCMYQRTENCFVSNTGHGTMQVSFPSGNRATIGNKYLELVQFHFHTPSEHAMDGRRFPMEVHLVHKDLYTGELTVLGVMLERGGRAENECLRLALDCAPEDGADPVCNKYTTFDPNMLLPKALRDGKRSYIYYQGSLTTPPCTENVNWYVFTEPLQITDSEILDFQEFAGAGMTLGMNARPVQNLNDRTFTYYDGL